MVSFCCGFKFWHDLVPFVSISPFRDGSIRLLQREDGGRNDRWQRRMRSQQYGRRLLRRRLRRPLLRWQRQLW
jgi:hypothetical protein